MSGATGKRLLQFVFIALGAIAIATGLLVVVSGSGGLPGENPASATVDNELRFFAAFWIAYGIVAIRVAPRVDTEARTVRVLALTLFAAGLARAASWLAVGQPHPLFASLMFAELIGAPLVVAWQARFSATTPWKA